MKKVYKLILLLLFTIQWGCSENIDTTDSYKEMEMIDETIYHRTYLINNNNINLYKKLSTKIDSASLMLLKNKSESLKKYIKEVKRCLISNHMYNSDTVKFYKFTINGYNKNGEKEKSTIISPLSHLPLRQCIDLENVQKTSAYFKRKTNNVELATLLKNELDNYTIDIVKLIEDDSGELKDLIDTHDVWDSKKEMVKTWESYRFTTTSFTYSYIYLELLLLDIELFENNALNKLALKALN